jgi:hypothetical protein
MIPSRIRRNARAVSILWARPTGHQLRRVRADGALPRRASTGGPLDGVDLRSVHHDGVVRPIFDDVLLSSLVFAADVTAQRTAGRRCSEGWAWRWNLITGMDTTTPEPMTAVTIRRVESLVGAGSRGDSGA